MVSLIIFFLCLVFTASAKPIVVESPPSFNQSLSAGLAKIHVSPLSYVQARDTPAIPLSILPIGDSITVGVCSSDGNGYRLYLRNMLRNGGFNPDFIGSQTSGDNNPDNRHEGYGWNRINQVLDKVRADGIIRQQPNLVLIHIGTNDNDWEATDDNKVVTETYLDAPTRLASMIDYVLCNDPNAVVLVAKLILNDYNQTQTNYFNDHVPSIVGDRYMKGYKVRLVDMSHVGDGERCDLLHPTDVGYYHMAKLWFEAIKNVPGEWWTLSDSPSPAVGGRMETCARDALSFVPALDGNVAPGFHFDGDTPEAPGGPGSTFTPAFGEGSVIGLGTAPPEVVQFVDLNGDGKADYLLTNSDTGAVRAWINKGDNSYDAMNNGDAIAFGTGTSSFVEFADLDGDKRPEYIVVSDGKFHIWRNGGQSGTVWQWSPFPAASDAITSVFPGGAVGFHYFGDMNGDGLADLCIVNPNGVLDFYIQQGQIGSDGFSWKQCLNAGIFVSGMMLVDIDGDGRADYLANDGNGGIKGWLNKPGGACGILWVPINDGSAVAIASGSGYTAAFADIDGDGKADYLSIEGSGGVARMFRNIGSNHAPDTTALGGFGAAVRLVDMDGDGKDDYVSVAANTYVTLHTNGGQIGSDWVWNDWGLIGYQDSSQTSRSEIQFADMNGDGFDDFLIVDKDTGTIKCWLNTPSTDGKSIKYQAMGMIAIGVGGTGANVRLADMDGDGRADYISPDLDEGGIARVWLNKGPGNYLSNWQPLNGGAADAIGVGAESIDVHFHDIDGDGRADYLWIHPDTGAVDVFYNEGEAAWSHGGQIMAGVGVSGAHVRFARIGTSGRPDFVTIDEDTGAIRAWLSQCSRVTGSRRSGSCAAPPLPTKTAPEPLPVPEIIDYVDWQDDNDGNGLVDNYDMSGELDICDYSLHFATLDDVLNSGVATSKPSCLGFHALQALIVMLDTAYDNYTSVDDGYDKEFGYYVTYITNLVPTILENNLMFNGSLADKDNSMEPVIGSSMKYFDCHVDGDSTLFPCSDMHKHDVARNMYQHNPTTLIPHDIDGFDKSLLDVGIIQDWVVFGEYTRSFTGGEAHKRQTAHYDFRDFPIPNPKPVVPNPKDIVTKGISNIPQLRREMEATLMDIAVGQWVGGLPEDAALVYSTPVFMLMQAVDGMVQAKQIGAEEEKREREEEENRKKNLILLILSIVFLFVPIIGEEAAAAAGLATLARTIAIAGELGNTALAIYDSVKEPDMAVVNILGQLFGVGAIAKATRDGPSFTNIAKIRRDMSADTVASLGKIFKDNDGKMKQIITAVCKAG